ncbi:hypothetical protein FNF31_01520 [Cafeteria roenbergensis]|uniref:DM10 domain-containing protein n=1 Tax=Cafeteria roenbergensis TaxID=33653 RepID=A0A5A8DNL3_CAFRO|nr:hypothetical protein FNF31_01520 [Cafeteria roenbergensis]
MNFGGRRVYIGTDRLEEVVRPADLDGGVTASIQRSYSRAVENRRSGKRVATHRKVSALPTRRRGGTPRTSAAGAGARLAPESGLLASRQPLAADGLDRAKPDEGESDDEDDALLEPGATAEQIATNVMAIDLESVRDPAPVGGPPGSVVLRCGNNRCGAMFSSFSRLEGSAWPCEFCGTRNGLPDGLDAGSVAGAAVAGSEAAGDADGEAVPSMVEFELARPGADGAGVAGPEPPGVVFVCDISGSMRATSLAPAGYVKPDAAAAEAAEERETRMMLQAAGLTAEEIDQQVAAMRAGAGRRHGSSGTYISRAEGLIAAITSQMKRMDERTPSARVALVTFNDEVTIRTAGAETSLSGEALRSVDGLLEAGAAAAGAFATPVSEAHKPLSDVVKGLDAQGPTALGPAVMVGMGIASRMPGGSRVIVITDGVANVGVGNLGDGSDEFAVLAEEDRGPDFYDRAGKIAAERGVVVDVVAITGEGAALEHLGSLAAAANGEIRTVGPGELAKEVAGIMSSDVLALNAHVTTVASSHLAFDNAEGWGWTTSAGNRAVAEAAEAAAAEAAEAAGAEGEAAAGGGAGAAGRGEGGGESPPRGGPLYGRLMPALPDDAATIGDGTGHHRVVTCAPLSDPRLLPPVAAAVAGPTSNAAAEDAEAEDPPAASGAGSGSGIEPAVSEEDPTGAPSDAAAAEPGSSQPDPPAADASAPASDGSSRVWRTPGNVVSGTELTLEFGRRAQPLPADVTAVPFQMQLWFSRPGDRRRILRVVTSMCPVSSDIEDVVSPANVVAPVVAAFARAKTAQLAALGDYARSRTTTRAYSQFLAQNAVMLSPECPPAPARAGRQRKAAESAPGRRSRAFGRSVASASRPGHMSLRGIAAPAGAAPGRGALREAKAEAAPSDVGPAMLMQWAQGLDGLDGAIAEELNAERDDGVSFDLLADAAAHDADDSDENSRPVARPKRQIFQAGGEIREPEAEAFDPSAHLVARADTMRRRGDREAVLFDKTARARDTLAGTGFGGASVRLDATSGAGAAPAAGDAAAAAAAVANGGMRSRMTLVASTGGRAGMGATGAAPVADGGSDLPPAVLAEKQVLRFFAWFREAVPESRRETNRIRLVAIQYFVETGDLAIHEPHTPNSGLPQGPIMRKGRVVKREREDGSHEYVDWRDLSVSDEVTFHGRTYRIYDADGFTREWFAARGLPLEDPEEVPKDVYAAEAAAAAEAARVPGRFKKTMYDEKLFQEARLGRFVRDPAARAKFQENDGKVLRFDCLWRDDREGGDTLHYVLQWHLKDDQAELLEVHDRNDGRDPTNVAVSKRRLPLKWRATLRMPGDMTAEAAENWATPSDIRVGSTLDVFGRNLFVRGADGFTRDWYRRTLGITQPDAVYDREPEPVVPTLPPPPHMGIGDPDDTIQSTKTFAPRPPKRDFDKWATYEGVVYRFKTRLVFPPELAHVADADRRFTVAIYPTDDTLGIFEPPRRNSGLSAGKFLARGKHRHESGRPFRPTDFRPGRTVVINTRTFHVDDADPFTRRAVPEVDLPVPEGSGDNMFPRGPTTTSLDGTMKAVSTSGRASAAVRG